MIIEQTIDRLFEMKLFGMAESVKKQLRQFTGSVSEQAVASPELDLRLEHYMRIQTTLTGLVTRHLQNTQPNPEEFIRTLFDYERVHIVTVGENYDAMRAKGDYTVAGIKLLPWASIPSDRRLVLWQRMLRGRVANAHDFLPIA